MMRKLCFVVIGMILFVAGAVKGEDKKPDAVKIEESQFPKQLVQDGILISNKTYRQIFKAYLGNKHPFITTDSLLNAYHVLYEESIFRLEKRQAGILKDLLIDIYQQLCRDKIYGAFMFSGQMTLKAVLRDKLIIGIAVKLFDPQFKLEDNELNILADIEAANIVKAEGISMPKWLGKPSKDFAGIDYSRFKPRGFYCKTSQLQRYFRATAWLQAIPFKVKSDDELLAFMVLRYCWRKLTSRFSDGQKYIMFFKVYDILLGKQDGQGIDGGSMWSSSYSREDMKLLRKELSESSEPALINDTVRESPISKTGIEELRIMPARITPDAVLFSLTTDFQKTQKNIPSGLEVSALLGSKFAMEQLSPQVRDIIKKQKNKISKESFYGLYIGALKTLFNNDGSKVPAFMKNKSWEIKSCNTALAGWAQLRHTWSLQAKQNINYLGLVHTDTGFVEPNEAFWGRMAFLCEFTRKVLNKLDCTEDNPKDDIELYRILSSQLEKKDIRIILRKHPEMMQVIESAFIAANIISEEKSLKSMDEKKRRVAALKKLVNILETDSLNKYPKLERILKQYSLDLNELWEQLHTTCLKLQIISLKQLNNIPRCPEENRFIADYGIIIAGIMLYGGNSYLTPKDDAPRIVDVFTNVDEAGIRYLEVGVARAREIQVLYPTPEGKVLCTGAVMPYYEFVSKDRLTDEQWKLMLDSDKKRPDIPKWMKTIVQDGKLKVPDMKERH